MTTTYGKLRVAFLMLVFGMAMPAGAGEVLGKITAIDYAKGTLSISGFPYRIAPAAVDKSEPGRQRAVELKHFRYGQVVAYTVEDGAITGLSLMKGLTDIPH